MTAIKFNSDVHLSNLQSAAMPRKNHLSKIYEVSDLDWIPAASLRRQLESPLMTVVSRTRILCTQSGSDWVHLFKTAQKIQVQLIAPITDQVICLVMNKTRKKSLRLPQRKEYRQRFVITYTVNTLCQTHPSSGNSWRVCGSSSSCRCPQAISAKCLQGICWSFPCYWFLNSCCIAVHGASGLVWLSSQKHSIPLCFQ